MNKEDLRHILQQPYQPEDWKKVFDLVFPNVSYLKSPQPIPFSNEKVESFKQLGAVRLNDGKNLAIFEVKVAPNVNIPRNRVELRNLVAPLIDQDRNHGVLVIYEQGSEDYRFTFTAKETVFDSDKVDFVNRETESKRFTYVLGANETCRTPADRLWELSARKEEATIKVIEEAFSVERLSKEFFTKYKQHYQAFVDYLTISHFKASAFNGDEKRIRDFVKVLLGRIVFLQFVQKKRWLGASDTHYTDGDKNFLQHFWNKSGKNESFYFAHLSRLFFDALNKNERSGQLFEMPDGSELCVPFLGGGLFEKDRNEPELLTFPPALFDGLFNFFAEYNFTIDENDPFENEVGIDPEMLGHIFENLLEDNKDKGAFYTPKPIVKYMCQESLIQYLLTQLEQNGVFSGESADKKVFEASIGNFVRKYEAHDLIDFDNILAKALHTVKVCDPAIGSGAFPMGILNEMVMLINVLHNASPDVVEDIWQMENWQPATVKRHIIQNSIYGVDIEKGAVDIARLRFWLSLILDEEKPNALPSLDYKIVVGNSLISKLDDDIIDIDWTLNPPALNLFGEDMVQRKKELFDEISGKQIAFFQPGSDKKTLAVEIRKLKIDLLIHQLHLMIEREDRAEPKIENYRNKPKAKFNEDFNKYLKCVGWKNQIEKLRRLKIEPNKPLEYFDWKLDFPEVLNEWINQNAGFDIIIGNPPYGANIDDLVSYFKVKFPKTTKGFKDIYKLFYNQGIEYLLKKDGMLSYITPNTFILQPRYKDLRQYFLNYKIVSILNLGENVFEEVTVPTAIISIKNVDSKTGLINFCDISKGSKYKGSLLKLNFKPIEQEAFKISESNIFTGSISIAKDDELFLEDIVDFKDAGINYQRINVGLSDKGNSDLSERLLYEGKKEKDSHIEYWKGSDINEFYISPNTNRFVRPNIRLRENERVILNENYFSEKPKLIWRQTASIPICVVDRIGIWFGRSIQAATIKASYKSKIKYEYLCCLLNSNYIRSIYEKKVQEGGRVFPQVKLEKLKKLPIKLINTEEQLMFVELCKKIERIRAKNSETSITEEMKTLNTNVYRLYELSYDEVKAIDPEFSLSKEDYDAIKLE